jgi:hypothetical protein
MRKSALLLLAGLAVVALAVSPVAAASRPAPAANVGQTDLAPDIPWTDAPTVTVLHDQRDSCGGVSIASQNFEAAYAAYDNCAADDFVVPGNAVWSIGGVAALGFVTADQPASFDVEIIQDNGSPPGMPGTVRVTRLNQGYQIAGGSEYRIRLNPDVNIPVSPNDRHLWITVKANLNFLPNGSQWYWTDRVPVDNMGAKWQNPNGGFGICPVWDSLDNCIVVNDGDDLCYGLVSIP